MIVLSGRLSKKTTYTYLKKGNLTTTTQFADSLVQKKVKAEKSRVYNISQSGMARKIK
jgi:hypothetical protein